jgi:hypothetical protein
MKYSRGSKMTFQEFFSDLPVAIGLAFVLLGLLIFFIIISLSIRVGIDNSKTNKMLKELLELQRKNNK